MRNQLEIHAGGALIRAVPEWPRIDGLYVAKDGLQGLRGVETRRREAAARAVEHGEHDVPVLLGSRVVTIDGHIIGRDIREMDDYGRQIAGLGSKGTHAEDGRLRFEVKQYGRWFSALGRVMAATVEPGFEFRADHFVTKFQVQVVFADPRWYGREEVFPETGTATEIVAAQRGNFPAHPIIEFPSGPSSATITSPAGTFSYSGLVAGGNVRVNMRTGRVSRNGIDQIDISTSGALWAIPRSKRWTHTLSAPGRVIVPRTDI